MNRTTSEDPNRDGVTEVPGPLLLPTDRPRRTTTPCPTAAEHLRLPESCAGALDAYAAGEGIGSETVLLACFTALGFRYTGQTAFAVTTAPGASVGVTVDGDATLSSLAHAVRASAAGGPSTVAFHTGAGASHADGSEAGTDGGAPVGEGHELALYVHRDAGRLDAEVHYDESLFDAATARHVLGHYTKLLTAALAAPDQAIATLALLTPDEQHTILVDWNATATDLAYEGCLHHRFEERAALSPDAVALVHGAERWSFARIDTAANQLARHLRQSGVAPGTRVGLCLDRSSDLLVSLLAVLKTGAAYVPLDPGYPAQRLATMVEGAGCVAMVSRSDLAANLGAAVDTGHTPLVLVDRDAHLIDAQTPERPDIHVTPDDLCYVIFTSGSTGRPKPIALRHRGVLNNLADLNTRYGVGPGDSVLALSSPSFDMSVYELVGMPLAGGTVVLPDRERIKDPAHWAELLTAHGVTVWNSAPALLDLLTAHAEQDGATAFPALRLAMLGGDWIPVTLPDRVRRIAPDLRFIALGGATESSIHSTLYEVMDTDPSWTSIPYGRPMANQRTYILDPAGHPVPVGVPGDLHLAGIGLAQGYLNQPERTAERFLDWSHGPVTSERLYRTGDLARYRRDGQIELLGRMDFQVKVNGLRIELGEVEARLREHPEVKDAVVAAQPDAVGDRQLVGYVVLREPAALDSAGLRCYLGELLPAYMVPAAMVVLDSLPLSANGKLDRKALPAPEEAAEAAADAGDAPRGPWEQRIAEVWQQTLGVADISRDADFFALGGDSMKAVRSIGKIGAPLKWADLYRHPVLKDLAAHMERLTAEAAR
ncbi:amino acid adenylation domain-containing protein [Streptomyces sp. V3I7]|uniref:non-ribosomal peptide synthetase n=1 Tax=Streptomyces sp. V3I7 TaxID=3042278 RepID=UPI00278A56E6|nr:amino acid adenylation domain-containing protein [Streptomyces sp. V3I7]MDQ0989107.1 amino acid adenylation domain-containing protein [Streptomyces sp. V3I7]